MSAMGSGILSYRPTAAAYPVRCSVPAPSLTAKNIALTKTADGRVRINGYCTCPVGISCKHLAAVLLEHLALDGDDDDEVRPDRAPSVPRVLTPQPSPHTPVLEAPSPAAVLTARTSRWLERLASLSAAPTTSQSAVSGNQRVLIYVLNHENASPPRSEPCVRIRPISARRRKDGSLTDEKFYNPENISRTNEQRPRFLTEADLEMLRSLLWLMRMGTVPGSQDIVLGSDAASRHIFEGLLQSGQLRYGAMDSAPLRVGPSARGEPCWIKAARGAQTLAFVPIGQAAPVGAAGTDCERRFDVILPLNPPHYIDLAEGVAGAIETGLPPEFALEVARAPTIAASEAAMVKEMMRQRLKPLREGEHVPGDISAQILPLPETPDNIEIQSIAPMPRLELMVADARVKPQYAWYSREANHHGGFQLPIARLSFDYGAEAVHPRAPEQTIERMEDGRLILTPRDIKAEATAAGRLARLGFKPFSALPFTVRPGASGRFVPGAAGDVQPLRNHRGMRRSGPLPRLLGRHGSRACQGRLASLLLRRLSLPHRRGRGGLVGGYRRRIGDRLVLLRDGRRVRRPSHQSHFATRGHPGQAAAPDHGAGAVAGKRRGADGAGG